jgi:hypothetical protein
MFDRQHSLSADQQYREARWHSARERRGAASLDRGQWYQLCTRREVVPQDGYRDFAIGRRIENLEELRKIRFAANRLLDVQRIVRGTFANKDLREHLAPLLGKTPSQLTPGLITLRPTSTDPRPKASAPGPGVRLKLGR